MDRSRKWLEGRLLQEKESFYRWLLYGWACCSKADSEWIWRWMLLMTVYIYNENTHGRQEWEEWSDKANQSTFITEETPTGGNSGRKEECLLKSWKNIECYYKTHTHGKQEWEEKKHEWAPLWPWVSTWAPLLPWETMKRIVFIHIYTMMHPIWHGSYSVNLTVFGTERTSQCIRICKHWCHFNWKYKGTVYGNRHITVYRDGIQRPRQLIHSNQESLP